MNSRDLKSQIRSKALQEAENLTFLIKASATTIILVGICYLIPQMAKAATNTIDQNNQLVSQQENQWESILPGSTLQ